jgi:PTS system ascorbate-specific IIA component
MELPLPDEAVRLRVPATDWRDAVRYAGAALTAAGITQAAYTEEMIATVEQLGPYIVIAPGIALAHSRPSPSVNHAGISWVTLATPVEFGNADNDPVSLVVGLAAVDHDGHIDLMAALAETLADEIRLPKALAATTPEALRAALAPTEEGQV